MYICLSGYVCIYLLYTCVKVCILSLPVIYRICICEFTYSLKHICNFICHNVLKIYSLCSFISLLLSDFNFLKCLMLFHRLLREALFIFSIFFWGVVLCLILHCFYCYGFNFFSSAVSSMHLFLPIEVFSSCDLYFSCLVGPFDSFL